MTTTQPNRSRTFSHKECRSPHLDWVINASLPLERKRCFSIEFFARARNADEVLSDIGVQVASVIMQTLTEELFRSEDGGSALSVSHGPVFPRLPVVRCLFPGPGSAPEGIRIYSTTDSVTKRNPQEFADHLTSGLARVMQPTEYYDQSLNLYTGGSRFVTQANVVRYLARAASCGGGETLAAPMALAEQFAQIGTTAAWAAFEPLGFNVNALGPRR